jgi:hypothetical protein
MTTYYRDLISGNVVTEEEAWAEAYENVDYEDALKQLLHYYSADEIIRNLPLAIQACTFGRAADQYVDENFEECDEPEEDEDDD